MALPFVQECELITPFDRLLSADDIEEFDTYEIFEELADRFADEEDVLELRNLIFEQVPNASTDKDLAACIQKILKLGHAIIPYASAWADTKPNDPARETTRAPDDDESPGAEGQANQNDAADDAKTTVGDEWDRLKQFLEN